MPAFMSKMPCTGGPPPGDRERRVGQGPARPDRVQVAQQQHRRRRRRLGQERRKTTIQLEDPGIATEALPGRIGASVPSECSCNAAMSRDGVSRATRACRRSNSTAARLLEHVPAEAGEPALDELEHPLLVGERPVQSGHRVAALEPLDEHVAPGRPERVGVGLRLSRGRPRVVAALVEPDRGRTAAT